MAATSVEVVDVLTEVVLTEAVLLLVGDGVAPSLAEGWPSETVSGTD